MKAYSVIAVMVSMLALTGCGAGSSDVQMLGYSAAIKQAATNYAATMPKIDNNPSIFVPGMPIVRQPDVTPYTGANVTAEGVDMGFIAGTDDVSVIKKITDVIISNPAKYQPVYALLLSAEGMHFTVQSNRAYLPSKYVAKLTSSGLVVEMV